MTEAICGKEFTGNSIFYEVFASEGRQQAVREARPYQLAIELTSKCYGSCAYCYATSTESSQPTLPTYRVLSLIDEAKKIGIQMIYWYGGEPTLHPDWYPLANYATDKGIANVFILSGLISKKLARMLCSVETTGVLVHIDSVVPESYSQVHTNPKTLESKMQGYRNLLEAGYPPEKVMGCITVTRPILSTLEPTLDYFLDEMGASYVIFAAFQGAGFGGDRRHWEPSRSELEWAFKYRAQRLKDENLLRTGISDASKFFCKGYIGVMYDGGVVPCLVIRDQVAGNIFEESLVDIFQRNRDALLFNFEVKGFCGEGCASRDVCFGCRSDAYFYTGDIQGSDPKCWLNPTDVREHYLPARQGK